MKKILIVNPYGIGDVIFTLSLVEALKKTQPSPWVTFLCNERTVDLLRLSPAVDRTLVFNRDEFRACRAQSHRRYFQKWLQLYHEIRNEKFDLMFDLSLGREFSFLAWRAGIKQRVGFDFKGRGLFLNKKKKILGYAGSSVAEIQLGLLGLAGFSYSGERFPVRLRASASEVPQEKKIISVAPGGGESWGNNAIFKQWPSERFSDVVNRLIESKGLGVVLIGSRVEASLLKEVGARLKTAPVYRTGESLERVCAVLKQSEFLLCNDGGLLHLANALGVKTLSIFGPVDEQVYGPYGNGTPHRTVRQPVPCGPCYQRFHFPPCKHHRRCLEEISVESILSAANDLL